ncbi:hypothetical protein Cha6605_0039 [Chamaesiphon minutus PCC 6605]|uniref:Transposase family protein n=1 Tax=Chamaesiphon minutus (strain ATCC 27169 / PCC 6605) TaxID=1173020 RepID=K9U8F8_CHAP6|nr:hypothetical protein Cha6605_0039 [Chamaesiphon minutus PCC 6605]
MLMGMLWLSIFYLYRSSIYLGAMKMVINNLSASAQKCPKCGTDRVGRAHRNKFDRLLSLINIYPYRCRQLACKSRFYRFGRST